MYETANIPLIILILFSDSPSETNSEHCITSLHVCKMYQRGKMISPPCIYHSYQHLCAVRLKYLHIKIRQNLLLHATEK